MMGNATTTKPRNDISAERLRAILNYDPETGVFVWHATRRSALNGRVAGCRHGAGYIHIRVDGRLYLAHRLAWLHLHGVWPASQIDHINGERSDNRIANLRQATNAENCQNVRAHSDGCGLIGATWSKSKLRWVAGIGVNGTRKNLGYFETAQAAHERYLEAKRLLHPFGASNHG